MSKKTPVTIKPYTPKLRLKLRTILRIGFGCYKESPEEWELSEEEFDDGFSNYAMMSVRVVGLNGDVGFELASPEDSPDDIKEKFTDYLETENVRLIRELEQLVMDSDQPINPETAPTGEGIEGEV